VLELIPSAFSVVGVYGSPDACDGVIGAAGRSAARVAADEVMLVGRVDEGEQLENMANEATRPIDPDALVIDVSDGWTVWTLHGSDAGEAMSRLSELEMPREGFLQGDVARLPARILSAPGRIDLMVPAMWGSHLRERILADCAALDVREGRATSPRGATGAEP
jgi:hypothetical protein